MGPSSVPLRRGHAYVAILGPVRTLWRGAHQTSIPEGGPLERLRCAASLDTILGAPDRNSRRRPKALTRMLEGRCVTAAGRGRALGRIVFAASWRECADIRRERRGRRPIRVYCI